ncbi:hypothetical protein BDU57DRAFT_444359 [Ampelomyces quisqualis]|uniref:Uncharacterized protein n=1 Tax=Ampelomyces quisqualis TaxID=50730 RepID=A0A6A5QS96_AMPQU|nr:hypothetical protein BDU57DRAFT_444359 [Ampelomyces quisqualis]
MSFTFDHRTLRTRLPVRSALFKQRTGGPVVRWVTTGESPLLNVFLLVLAGWEEVDGCWNFPRCHRAADATEHETFLVLSPAFKFRAIVGKVILLP